MKVPINLNEMGSQQLMQLARACVREVNEREFHTQFQIKKKS